MNPSKGRKTIFITGAASGMGRATANLFFEKGWYVGAYDVNADGLEKLKSMFGEENCITGVLDVTDRAAYKRAIAAFAEATDGRMDILFNNAGIGRGGLFADMSFEDIMAVVNTNFVGVMIGIHLAIPLLKATPNSLCFSTSSSSATFGMAGIAVYSATKHAVKGLTEALAVELRNDGVRVADTLPGLIDTPILPPTAAENAPASGMWRLMPPQAVAEVVWAAYHSDKIHWYVPEELAQYDQLATAHPEQIRDQMANARAPIPRQP